MASGNAHVAGMETVGVYTKEEQQQWVSRMWYRYEHRVSRTTVSLGIISSEKHTKNPPCRQMVRSSVFFPTTCRGSYHFAWPCLQASFKFAMAKNKLLHTNANKSCLPMRLILSRRTTLVATAFKMRVSFVRRSVLCKLWDATVKNRALDHPIKLCKLLQNYRKLLELLAWHCLVNISFFQVVNCKKLDS